MAVPAFLDKVHGIYLRWPSFDRKRGSLANLDRHAKPTGEAGILFRRPMGDRLRWGRFGKAVLDKVRGIYLRWPIVDRERGRLANLERQMTPRGGAGTIIRRPMVDHLRWGSCGKAILAKVRGINLLWPSFDRERSILANLDRHIASANLRGFRRLRAVLWRTARAVLRARTLDNFRLHSLFTHNVAVKECFPPAKANR
jgi:hypothetical protein